jgi:hypothetical protein
MPIDSRLIKDLQAALRRDPDCPVLQNSLSACRIAWSTARRLGHPNPDDAVSEALRFLVEHRGKPWPQIAANLARMLRDYVRDDVVARVPCRRIREAVACGQEVPRIRLPERYAYPDTTLDIFDLVESLGPNERVAIAMRQQAAPQAEIGAALGISQQRVSEIFQNLPVELRSPPFFSRKAKVPA